MDFTKVPEILEQSDFENERPRNLRQMGELLKISYELLDHPLLKRWRDHDPVDPFLNILDNDHYKSFNRTIIERTIFHANYFSQVDLGDQIVTMSSKGIEFAIEQIKWFLITANKIVEQSESENSQVDASDLYFRQVGTGQLTAAIKYFMRVCNDMVSLIQKRFLQIGISKIEKDEDKVKYLLKSKASLLHSKDQYDEKTFEDILNFIQIELDYHKDVKSFLDVSEELRAIVKQFLSEKNARISNHKLLAYLLQENMEMFCEELKTLVLQLFSYHDISGNVPEKVYHAFLLGFFNSFSDDFQLESNKEAGTGRFDILLIPNTQEYKGLVIEVKKSDTNDPGKVDAILDEALAQILRNKYAVELQKHGHKSFIGVAAVFFGKELFLKYRIYSV